MNDRSLRRRVLREARAWIGTPYLHQASTRSHGCDCLGLVRGIWRKVIGREPQLMPAYSSDWGEVSATETMLIAANAWFVPIEVSNALAGDLILFRWKGTCVAKHAGILAGHRNFIHAYERAGVVETSLGNSWQNRIAGAFRFPGDHPSESWN